MQYSRELGAGVVSGVAVALYTAGFPANGGSVNRSEHVGNATRGVCPWTRVGTKTTPTNARARVIAAIASVVTVAPTSRVDLFMIPPFSVPRILCVIASFYIRRKGRNTSTEGSARPTAAVVVIELEAGAVGVRNDIREKN
jgi:hypothetical protein